MRIIQNREMARSDSSIESKNKRKNLRAHFDEENIRKTCHPKKKDYGFDQITEPKTPHPRVEPPVNAEVLRQRLNAEVQRINDNENANTSQNENQNARNSGGRSDYLNKLCSQKCQESCRVNEQVSNTGNSEISMKMERSSNTAQPGVSTSSMSEIDEQEISISDSFEERRRRFYAQEFKIAKEMLESCHEMDEH